MGRAEKALVVAVSIGILGASGCALLEISEQRDALQAIVEIRGEVRAQEPTGAPLVVVLLRQGPPPAKERIIDDHFAMERPGSYLFSTSPGRFRLAAFEDRNANLVYDPGEPLRTGLPFFEARSGETLHQPEIVIPPDESLDERFDLASLEARVPRDQQHFTLGRFTARGEIVELADPRFGPDAGPLGMWRFVDFIFERGPGVYFLGPYEPDKIPVLYVHGINGFPQSFSTLIEQLDRDRFQPWFYFYPSGVHLEAIAGHLTEVVTELQILHDFDRMAVVAHSMGGLVSRAFILEHWERTRRRDVRLFIAISSPWGGSEGAAFTDKAPEDFVVYSWLDMDPESEFLRSLFYDPTRGQRFRALPPHTAFHMLFSYRRDESSFGPSADGVVTIKSQARLEAIESAQSILPLDYGHVDILHSGEAVNRVNGILGEAFD